MDLILTIGVIALVFTTFSIESRLRKTSEQNNEIIALLKEMKKNNPTDGKTLGEQD